MTGVRNGVLGRLITTGSGFVAVYTCPAGDQALIKTVHVVNTGSMTTRALLQLSSSDGLIVAVILDEPVDAGKHTSWYGWTALNPGDQLQVFADHAGVHVWMAGAQLPGVV